MFSRRRFALGSLGCRSRTRGGDGERCRSRHRLGGHVSYTGAPQTYTVPAGADYVRVTAVGGAGAAALFSGGADAQVSNDLPVFPGETLYAVVGGPGVLATGGYNGGGDADATSGGAAGGGAGGGRDGVGGLGGYPDGQDGQTGNAAVSAACNTREGLREKLQLGWTTRHRRQFGHGGYYNGAGGGGGGYYGGGGGACGGSGGGGSSYVTAGAKGTLSGRLVPVSGASGTGWHATGKVLGSRAIERMTLTSAERGHVGTYVISLTYHRGIDSYTMRQAIWVGRATNPPPRRRALLARPTVITSSG
jgi:hypothetical protein